MAISTIVLYFRSGNTLFDFAITLDGIFSGNYVGPVSYLTEKLDDNPELEAKLLC